MTATLEPTSGSTGAGPDAATPFDVPTHPASGGARGRSTPPVPPVGPSGSPAPRRTGRGRPPWSTGSVRWSWVRVGDVALVQLLLVGLLTLVVVVASVTGGPVGPLGLTAQALVLLALAGGAAVAGRLPGCQVAVLPVLDLVAVALLGPDAGLAAGLAVGVPALWLGMRLGRVGIPVAAATTLLSQGAVLLLHGTTAATAVAALNPGRAWAQVVLVAAGAGAVAAAAAFTRHRLDQAWEEVETEQQRTQALIDSVDVGLLELDADGRYRSVNRQHEHFMALASPGHHPRAVGARGSIFCADGVTPLPADQVPTTRAMRGEPLDNELCWVGPDPAHRKALTISSTPRHAPDGSVIGVVLAFKDVTDLLHALRVKDEFVASVSHELRTPLTSIIGYVDVVLEDTDDVPDDVRHHLEAVRRNSRRLRRLVDDLLTTAGRAGRASADDLRLDLVAVDHLLGSCTREARTVAHEKGLTLELDTAGADAGLAVRGDEERLAQVFDNLLGNAVKYTDPGGHVGASVDAEGDEVVVRVRDTGRGIAPEDVGVIFESFYRTRDVQGDAIPGVGLGLAITKRIVEAHGGRIAATSALGVGTTVEVRLPRVDPVPASAPAQASAPTNGVE